MARVSTTLFTPEEMFRLRNVEYLVFGEHLPEVLIGRPVLEAMGFHLDDYLAAVRTRYHGTDFFHFFIFGGNSVALSSYLFPIGYGNKVSVNIVNVNVVIRLHPGQLSVWNFTTW